MLKITTNSLFLQGRTERGETRATPCDALTLLFFPRTRTSISTMDVGDSKDNWTERRISGNLPSLSNPSSSRIISGKTIF